MGGSQRAGRVVGGIIAVVLVVGGLVGAGYAAFLYVFDPVADEWHCSKGKAPAGRDGFYNECFRIDRGLPPGYEWDPYGNRPMAYNCDDEGWVLVARPYIRGLDTEYERDCVREATDLPRRWRVVERR